MARRNWNDAPVEFNSFPPWSGISSLCSMIRHFKNLYVQVLLAIFIGALVGHFFKKWGIELKPLADAFIKMIKALMAPLIFLTLVSGIGGVGNLRKVGRIGFKTILYFEVATTIALALGLVVVNGLRPGAGLHIDPKSLNPSEVAPFISAAKHLTVVEFLLNLIPETVVGAFSNGDILPVLFLGLLTGISLGRLGTRAQPVLEWMQRATEVLMGVVGLVMRFAPVAAFGAMAYTVGKFGTSTLVSLSWLMACVYLTCAVFIFGGLGLVLRLHGFRLWLLLRYIREEILLVFSTSTSESALPRMLVRMEELGCGKSVVGLVLPAGYSLNLDGTCIYLTMATVFIAQATDTPLPIERQLEILAVLLLTSKGAAAVTGGGFVTLAATLAATDSLPVAGLTLLLGVDRFMSEARALTNLIGNAVATLIISRWEGELDEKKLRRELGKK